MNPEANVIRSYDDLAAMMTKAGVLHQGNIEKKELYLPVQRGELNGVMMLRWQDTDGVIQFVQSINMEVPEAAIPQLETAIVRLNHGMAIPGFDLNHANRILAFRVYLPYQPQGYVTEQQVQAMFQVALFNATKLLKTFQRIISGESKPETILDDARQDWSQPEPNPNPNPA